MPVAKCFLEFLNLPARVTCIQAWKYELSALPSCCKLFDRNTASGNAMSKIASFSSSRFASGRASLETLSHVSRQKHRKAKNACEGQQGS